MPRTTPPVQSVGDVLEAAADLLSKPGAWTQGAFREGDCFCVLGAIAFITGDNPDGSWYGNTAAAAREPLAMVVGVKTYDVVGWNDDPERTQDEVVAKLREAAAKARAESIA